MSCYIEQLAMATKSLAMASWTFHHSPWPPICSTWRAMALSSRVKFHFHSKISILNPQCPNLFPMFVQTFIDIKDTQIHIKLEPKHHSITIHHLTHFCKNFQKPNNFTPQLYDYDYPRFQS